MLLQDYVPLTSKHRTMIRPRWLIAVSVIVAFLPIGSSRLLRKVHATIPYTIEGKQTIVGSNGTPGTYDVGGQVLFHYALRDSG